MQSTIFFIFNILMRGLWVIWLKVRKFNFLTKRDERRQLRCARRYFKKQTKFLILLTRSISMFVQK